MPFGGTFREAMDQCRRLSHQCSVAFERTVRALAEDLQEDFNAGGLHLGVEFGTIRWTLGLMP